MARWAPPAAIIFAFSLAVGVFPAPSAEPEFDAASIKPWKPASGGGGSRSGDGLPAPDGGHLQYSPGRVATPRAGVTVKRIIQEAYGISNYRVSGGPAWIDTDMFKLEARSADPSADEGQLRLMLRTLLSKRFHLEFRHETRETPVYALTVAKGGVKIHEWKESGNPDATRAALQAEFAKGADDASITNMATFVDRMNSDRTNIHRRMIGLDRPVVDKTGLGGTYLFALQPAPEEDYKTVLENQLGLKFIPQKAMVDTLVIARIEKPDAN
jgi:uncharacterized protein (TIGR03435 family)